MRPSSMVKKVLFCKTNAFSNAATSVAGVVNGRGLRKRSVV